jgi:DNA helicase IV
MSALEDEWMARDNDSNDDMLNDIAGLKSDVEDLFEKASKADSQLQLNIVELSDKTFKEFGRIKDLISELNKLIAIAQKTSELNKILIDEIKAEASNPLGG